MNRAGLIVIALLAVLAVVIGYDFAKQGEPPQADPPEGSPSLRRALEQHGFSVPALQVHHATENGTVYRFDLDAAKAIATWERLRPLVAELGYYPIVCRDEHGSLVDVLLFNAAPPSRSIEVARGLDVAAWRRERIEGDPEYYGTLELGAWEAMEPQAGWTVPVELGKGTPADGVFMVLVPTTRPWEALAYMHFGSWNECPAPESHVAVHKDWHARFGAEIVCLSGDTVEMRVARPPTEREGALALAREQFVYSGGDLVFQGYDSLRRLAGALVNARYWYFWWD